MRRLATLAVLVAMTAGAGANGRPPQTMTINFKRGSDLEIVAGLTFGALVSHDGGATWFWMCEAAIGYGGVYDPDYELVPSGAVFATTFDGLRVARDGCTFGTTVQGNNFIPRITVGSDDAIYAAMMSPALGGNPGDSAIYKSTDDGMSFPTSTTPGQVGDLWVSLEAAPSDAQRVYLTGTRMVEGVTTQLLFQSADGGASFAPMSADGFTLGAFSAIQIAGISRTNADLVFARVTFENGLGEGIYRHTAGGLGGSWTRILGAGAEVAFTVRANGDLVAGTIAEGAFVSHDNGDNWEPLVAPPQINCLAENAAGEVWACTQNFGPDDAGIMKSTDLVTWTKVLRYQDIMAPVDCPAGSVQDTECESTWCAFKDMFGITSTAIDCPVFVEAPPGFAAPSGCCQTDGASPAGFTLLGIGVLLVLQRRRRR